MLNEILTRAQVAFNLLKRVSQSGELAELELEFYIEQIKLYRFTKNL